MITDQERLEVARNAKAEQELRGKREMLAAARDAIERRLGVRIEAERLDISETRDLRALVERVTAIDERENERGTLRNAWDPGVLDKKETKRFERLIEKAADRPKLFKNRHDAALREQASAEAGTLLRRMSRPQRPLLAAAGTVQVPAWLVEWLLSDAVDFGIADLGLVVTVLGAIENRVDHLHGVRVEGDELVVDDMNTTGIGGYTVDPDQLVMPRRAQLLDWLAQNGVLTVTKRGPQWRISRGPYFLADETEALVRVDAQRHAR